MTKPNKWSPKSWRKFKISQQPSYEDQDLLQKILKKISLYPPLIFAGEVEALKTELAEASQGKRFLLQGGDCAERFKDCTPEAITSKLKILLQMSVILCYGSRKPIIRVGRIAGQYSKPRSQNSEKVNGVELPVYRGDNINSYHATKEQRKASPQRLIQGYHLSAITLNYIRALISGGFADLHHPDNWDLDFVTKSSHLNAYKEIVANIKNAIDFMETIGYQENHLAKVDFYTSHEGLLLAYEEALTHYYPETKRFYNLGAHMLWIGDRTRQLDGAHIEYFRGIANPIGIKVGPSSDLDEIVKLIHALSPEQEPGRITLITRFGCDKTATLLPKLIKKVRASSYKNICWSCDPMHGNAIKTSDNIKTRDFDAILKELQLSFEIHKDLGSHLGGVHFELTGENVTECTGGAENISVSDLSKNYKTYCDPRLNYSQSLEMAFLISTMLED